MTTKPMPEQVFDHVITLVGLSYENDAQTKVLLKEADRAIRELNLSHAKSQQQLKVIADDLQKKYAPANVEAAVKATQGVLGDFEQASKAASARVQTAARDARQSLVEYGQWGRVMLLVGGVSFVVGLIISPLLASALPTGLQTRIAATVMKNDRWEAGAELMEAGDSARWGAVLAAAKMDNGNRDALRACREAAIKAGKEQHCVITVAGP